MLVALAPDGTRLEAPSAVKGPNFSCPGCKETVKLAKGRIRRHYFAHLNGSVCRYATKETWQHEQGKTDIAAALRARGVECDLEVDVLSIDGDRRADVLVTAPGGEYQIAIEVQHSPIDYSALETRTGAYITAGFAVVWVPVLDRGKLEKPGRIEGTNFYYFGQYSAPPWQIWIHALQGRLWFYDPVIRAFWVGKFDKSMIYENPRTWFDGGSEQSSGGYWRSSTRWSTLFLEGPFELAQMRLRRFKRPASKGNGFRLPEGRIADFMFLDEPVGEQMPLRIGSAIAGVNSLYYRPEILLNGEWVEVGFRVVELPGAAVNQSGPAHGADSAAA
jgi:competence protein CoiA